MILCDKIIKKDYILDKGCGLCVVILFNNFK